MCSPFLSTLSLSERGAGTRLKLMRLTGREDQPFTHVIANLEMIFLLLFLNLLFACVLHSFGVSNIKNHYKVTALVLQLAVPVVEIWSFIYSLRHMRVIQSTHKCPAFNISRLYARFWYNIVINWNQGGRGFDYHCNVPCILYSHA